MSPLVVKERRNLATCFRHEGKYVVTSINLGILKVRLLQQITFHPEGQQVKSHVHLTPSEIDRLASLAETFLPH